MRTQKYLKLHKRALAILEMIESCDRILSENKDFMTHYDAPWFSFTRPMYEKRIAKYTAIKQRLVIYYSDVMKRIIEPAMSNAIQIGTIVINEQGYAHAI